MRQKRMIAVRGIAGHIELTREAAIRGGAADLGSKVVIELNNDRIVQGPPAAVDRDPGAGGTNGRAEGNARLDRKAAGPLVIIAVGDGDLWLPKNKAGTLKEQLKKPWLSVEQGTIKGTLIPVVSPEKNRIVTDEFGVMKPDGLALMVSP